MKPSRRSKLLVYIPRFLVAVVLFWLVGCATAPHREDNTARLIAHPQFQAAVDSAPEWVSDALQAITTLEEKLPTAK